MSSTAEGVRARTVSRRRLVGLCILLPLAFAGLGAWQVQRSARDADRYGEETRGLDPTIKQLAALAERDPMRVVHFENRPDAYAAPVAVQMVRDGQAVLRRDGIMARLREGVAAGTIAAALLALAAGCAGLAIASRVARTGLESRARLVQAFTRIQRVLPGLLGTISVCTLLAAAFAVLFEAAGAWYLDQINGAEMKLVSVGLAVAGGAAWLAILTLRRLWRAIGAFKPRPRPTLGRAVGPADAPGLWAFIADLVRRQAALAPDNVVVGLVDGFFVTASDIALSPEGRVLTGRTLYVPAPYLALLSREETTAIVCHELAHFAGEDTAYSQRFLPVYVGIERSLALVNDQSSASSLGLMPATALGLHMMDVFDSSVNHWSRVREFAADAAALPQVGAAAVGSALIRTGGIAEIVDAVLGETARRPGEAPPDLVTAVVRRAERDGFGDPLPTLAERQPHPTDTHPPTGQRVQAVGVAVDDALLGLAMRPVAPADDLFAARLFADWAGLCATLSADAVAVATRRDRAFEAALQAAVAAPVAPEMALFENIRRSMFIIGLLAAVFLGIGGFLAYVLAFDTMADPSAFPMVVLVDAGLLAVGALTVALGVRRVRSRRTPFLVLTTEGFRCRGLDRAVPWVQVARISVTAVRGVGTVFFLTPDAAVPKNLSAWGIRVSARRRTVTILTARPNGLTPQAYLDLLSTYSSAAFARQALAERQGVPAPYTMVLSEAELAAKLRD